MKFEVYYDVSNDWRWRLRATNGKIIATSGEGYENKGDCEHEIRKIKGGAHLATIEYV